MNNVICKNNYLFHQYFIQKNSSKDMVKYEKIKFHYAIEIKAKKRYNITIKEDNKISSLL